MCVMSVIVAFRGFICPCFFADVYPYCLRGESGNNGYFWLSCGHSLDFLQRGYIGRGVVPGAAPTGSPKSGFKKIFFEKIYKKHLYNIDYQRLIQPGKV